MHCSAEGAAAGESADPLGRACGDAAMKRERIPVCGCLSGGDEESG